VKWTVGGVMPPRYIKTEGTPSLQSVTKGSYKYRPLKNFFPYIKSMVRFKNMQKNSGEIFTSIEVDTVTGEYYTVIPEAIVNELGWFEETPLKWSMDGKEAIITEQN
tara:strand:+ start:372 stop:692 length:321 start_codon:yes stop_codon:yes gene_type:complete